MKYIYIEDEIAAKTKYNTISNAIAKNYFKIRYFPRDNVYCIDTTNNITDRVLKYLDNEIKLFYPGAKLVK